jgi:hypothetical protein
VHYAQQTLLSQVDEDLVRTIQSAPTAQATGGEAVPSRDVNQIRELNALVGEFGNHLADLRMECW